MEEWVEWRERFSHLSSGFQSGDGAECEAVCARVCACIPISVHRVSVCRCVLITAG